MTWYNNIPNKEGFWLAISRDLKIPVLLETRIENHQYADFFGIRVPNTDGFLIPYISSCDKVTAYDKYEKYCFIDYEYN